MIHVSVCSWQDLRTQLIAVKKYLKTCRKAQRYQYLAVTEMLFCVVLIHVHVHELSTAWMLLLRGTYHGRLMYTVTLLMTLFKWELQAESIHKAVVAALYRVQTHRHDVFSVNWQYVYMFVMFVHRSGWSCVIWSPFSLTLSSTWTPVLWAFCVWCVCRIYIPYMSVLCLLQLCQGKGFVCEFCSSPDIIYPFELDKVSTCSGEWKLQYAFHGV